MRERILIYEAAFHHKRASEWRTRFIAQARLLIDIGLRCTLYGDVHWMEMYIGLRCH